MFSATRRLFVIGLISLLPPGAAAAQAIRITDIHVDKPRVQPGEPFTVAVMASGGANYCLRHDRLDQQQVLPGWRSHGDEYAFLPSSDFPGPGPYKNPENCHRDNGEHDLDDRDGVFRIAVDTTGWPEGAYQFLIMATNRPALGEYRGDARAFTILVGDVSGAGSISQRLEIDVNQRRCTADDPGWPIYPGRPNRLSVRIRESKELPLQVTFVRTQPDGRQVRSSATLEDQTSQTVFDLGLFAVPTEFDFEAGVLYRRGCRLRLEIRRPAEHEPLEVLDFLQTIDSTGQSEILAPGASERVPHFGGRPGDSRPMDPPVLLWLDAAVLNDPDDVLVCYQLRSAEHRLAVEPSLTGVPAILRITSEDGGQPVYEEQVEVLPQQSQKRLDVAGWSDGRYRIEIEPQVAGSEDRHGPAIVYRRSRPAEDAVRLSPLAPWTMQRDDSRPEVVVQDFRAAVNEWSTGLPDQETWRFHEASPGRVFLVTPPGDWRRPPVVLRPGLSGPYAVFATTEKSHCYLRIGEQGIVRGILAEPCFVEVAEMTGGQVAVYPASVPGSGLRELRFVPVTRGSAERVAEATRHPPVPLRGVADWCDYFAPPSSHHSAGARLGADQFDALLQGHAELGMSSIGWSIGRSWVEYDSKLPDATRFPCVPLDQIPQQYQHAYAGRAAMINDDDPLAYVLEHRAEHQLQILPWLAMQRHYGETAYGGIFCSEWFRAHPQWRRWNKNASAASGNAVSYYFPQVRKERVDILCEVAERSPDGLVVGWCRQVPILLYHPEMVAEYRARTGVDPLKIDANHEQEYDAWIRWRADFVTEMLRELKSRLEPVRRQTGRPIPVVVRIPSKGLFYNLAQGLDIETWCREALIDQIQLDPLEDCGWRGEPHDVRPYLKLGARYGLPIFGGINGNTFWNLTAILRRAVGLLQAGVAGIELYESNNFASISPRRWMIPLLGNLAELRDFLENSNLDACYPVWSRNAAAGYDNHSFSGNWSVYGMGGNSL